MVVNHSINIYLWLQSLIFLIRSWVWILYPSIWLFRVQPRKFCWGCSEYTCMYHNSYGLFRKLAKHKCTCVCKCLGLSILSIIQLFSSCVYLLCILFIYPCTIFLLHLEHCWRPLIGKKTELNWIVQCRPNKGTDALFRMTGS